MSKRTPNKKSLLRLMGATDAALRWHYRNVGETPTHAHILNAFKAGAEWQRKRR